TKEREDREYKQFGYPYEDIMYELSFQPVFTIDLRSLDHVKKELDRLDAEGVIDSDAKKQFLSFVNSKLDNESPEECEPILKMLQRRGVERDFALAYSMYNVGTVFDTGKRSDVLARKAVQAIITDRTNSGDVTLFWTFAPYLFEELKEREIEEKRAMVLVLKWARTGVARYSPEREKKGKEMYRVNLKGLDSLKPYSLSGSQDDISHVFTKQESKRVVDLILAMKNNKP
ncbi:MAG: hypothetical protein AAB855_04265, partial [Patescibacteria group bacterium]